MKNVVTARLLKQSSRLSRETAEARSDTFPSEMACRIINKYFSLNREGCGAPLEVPARANEPANGAGRLGLNASHR